MEMSWPQFRMFKDRKRLFKIESPEVFEEYKVWGSYLEHYKVKVKQYNDRLLLHEILTSETIYIPITEDEFNRQLSGFESSYKKIN